MKISRAVSTTRAQNNKPNKLKALIPLMSGGLVFPLAYNLAEIPFALYEEKTDKFLRLNKNESEIINKTSEKAFEASGLKKAGVKFISVPVFEDVECFDVLSESSKIINKADKTEADKAIIDAFFDFDPPKNAFGKAIDNFGSFLSSKKDGNKFLNRLHRVLYGDDISFCDLDAFALLKSGDGAFYYPYKKTVFVPESGSNLAAFHEMGHAMNDALSKTGKFLQHIDTYSKYVAGGILLTSLLAGDEKENDKNPLNKAANFVKKNAGKLIFLSFAPKIVEEGLASYKGEKLAKNLLDEKLFQKLKNANKIALSTYVISALIPALCGYLAIKAKDFVSDKLNKSKKPFFAEENCSTHSAQDGN